MKPVSVFFPFIGDEIGGSHISAAKLIAALDQTAVRPIVGLHDPDGPVAKDLAARGIAFVRLPGAPFPSRRTSASGTSLAAYLLHNTAAFARFLRGNSIEIVHTNDGRMHVAWAAAARLSGARHVWHHRGDPKARGVNLLAPFCASHIIAVSRFAMPDGPLLRLMARRSVIYSPFDQSAGMPAREEARADLVGMLGCAPQTALLGYFGLLIDRKRPLRFVEAVAAFVSRYPDMPLMGLLFGVPGSECPDLDRAVLDRAAELGVSDRIRLMGYRQPIEPFMCGVDILLVPAVREPFGRTLIEAMYARTPVVAADDGGNREAIVSGENGFLVAADRPEAFVEPVHLLLSDAQTRERITRNAFTQAHERYGVDRHIAEVTELYRKLAGRAMPTHAEQAQSIEKRACRDAVEGL